LLVSGVKKEVEMQSIRPVFILGLPRSGTTLLQSLLDGHPDLLVNFAESHFFRKLFRGLPKLSPYAKVSLAEEVLFQHFIKRDEYYNRYLREVSYFTIKERFYQYLSGPIENSGQYLTAAILAYGAATNQLHKKYWVEKTPHDDKFTELIFSLWPDARCIHVMRDPRAVYSTLKRRAASKNTTTRLGASVYQWRWSADVAIQNQMRFDRSQYLVIRYCQAPNL